jgi:hypothetical protein
MKDLCGGMIYMLGGGHWAAGNMCNVQSNICLRGKSLQDAERDVPRQQPAVDQHVLVSIKPAASDTHV